MNVSFQNEHVTTGTLLHLLAFVGRHEAVKWLLDNGAHPHTVNHSGSTPLHVAALRHHPEVIKVLRFYHADAYTENNVSLFRPLPQCSGTRVCI